MALLLLIRHGLTDAARDGVLTGWMPGVHLSERGREQAGALAERTAKLPIAAIYSSPLERCRETAVALAAPRGLRVAVRRDLGEVRFGDWTGRRLSQLGRTKLWRAIQQTPSRARFPGGESLVETQERAVAETGRILAAHPKATIALVSHAEVIRLLLAHFAGVHVDLFQRIVVEPASVSAVAAGDGRPAILKMNDTGDLDGLLSREPRAGVAGVRKVRG